MGSVGSGNWEGPGGINSMYMAAKGEAGDNGKKWEYCPSSY